MAASGLAARSSKRSCRRILISFAALIINVSATISGSGTGSGDFTTRWTSRSTRSVVLPVPAPAVTTTFRSNVVAASVRACASRISATALSPFLFSRSLLDLGGLRLVLGRLEPVELLEFLAGLIPARAPPALIVMAAAHLGVVAMLAVNARQDEEPAGPDALEDERQGAPDEGARLARPTGRIQGTPVQRPVLAIGRE